jgi:hypothetical protein
MGTESEDVAVAIDSLASQGVSGRTRRCRLEKWTQFALLFCQHQASCSSRE